MKKKVLNIIVSLLIVIAIFIDFKTVYKIKNLNYSSFYNINIIAMSILTIFMYYLINKKPFKLEGDFKKFLCILFSIFMVVGEIFVAKGNITYLWKNISMGILTIIKLVGYSCLFNLVFVYIEDKLKKSKNEDLKPKKKIIKWYIDKFNKYPFRTSFISILIIIGIYMFAFYPIVLSPDPSNQIKMFLNEPTKYIDWVIQRNPLINMTTHHPVLQTWLIGYSLKLGRFLINDNFGLFIYTFMQSVIYASVLAYTVSFAAKNNVKSKYRLALLLIYLFVPMYALYSVSAVKDTLYTAFMIMYVLFIFDILKNYTNKKIGIGYLIHFIGITVLLCLIRHNGFYIFIVMTPFILLSNKKNIIRLSISSFVVLTSIFGFNKVLIPYLGISEGSTREVLSVPFQQTARYVKYYGDTLSEEDKEVIDKILGYDTLGTRYNSRLSDPVKNEYNKYTTTEDLKVYFKVWLKGLGDKPLTYINATLANTYGYFYPNTHRWYVYTDYDDRVTENGLVDYHYVESRKSIRSILTGYANIFPYIPLFGIISSTGISLWVILVLIAYLKKNYKKYLIVLLPLIGTWGFCILGPANTYFRYVMPMLYVIPVLVLLMLCNLRGEQNEKK